MSDNPFREGYDAFNDGEMFGDNPYSVDDRSYREWMIGWLTASEDKQEAEEDDWLAECADRQEANQ